MTLANDDLIDQIMLVEDITDKILNLTITIKKTTQEYNLKELWMD